MYALPCNPLCTPAIVRVIKLKPRIDLNKVYAIGYGGTTGKWSYAPVVSS